jgi:S-DNA-T family DNA segregation ATPase FtsK/SpoIIIE
MIDWVCPECGLDYGTLTAEALPVRAAPLPDRWRAALADVEDGRLRRRPAPEVWSPIEYAAHTRDVVGELTQTLRAMTRDSPMPAPSDPDEVVLERRYAEADLTAVLDGLQAENDGFLTFLGGLTPAQASLEHEFPWGTRDVLTIAGNAVHEQTHHLLDVERQVAGDVGGGGGDLSRA